MTGIQFPFNELSIDYLDGLPLRLAFVNGSHIQRTQDINVTDGIWGKNKTIDVNEDLTLQFLDEHGSPEYEFDHLSHVYQEQVLMGICVKTNQKVLLYVRNETSNFTVAISTCKKYEPHTLSRILRSLRKEKFPLHNVIVVSGGHDEYQCHSDGEYVRYEVKEDVRGLNGLIPFLKNENGAHTTEYVLLLHDTMEVTRGFGDYRLDVGIPCDFIGILPEFNDIGFWSVDFLRKLSQKPGFSLLGSRNPFDAVEHHCKYRKCIGDCDRLRSKDVYGVGETRQVLQGLFVKKYKRA